MICLFLSLLFFLSLLKPRWAILACLVILPTYLLKLSILEIPTTVLELSIYVVFIGSFFPVLINKSFFSASSALLRVLRASSFFWPILAWLIITLVSATLSDGIKTALGGWKAWVFDPILVLVLIIHFFDQKNIWKIAAALGISSAVLSLYGLLEYFLWPWQLGDGRLDSVFDPANYHALFVGPIIVLAIGFIFSPQILPAGRQAPRIWKFFLSAASAINILALVFTFSYGGYLAVLGGLILLGILSLDKIWKKRIIFGGIAIFIIFILLAAPTKKFQDLFEYKERSSGHARLEIWQTSLLIFKEHPILGVGMNNFETAYRDTIPRVAFPPLEWLVAQPHNLYLALLTQTGLLGFAIFAWIIINFFRITFQYNQIPRTIRYTPFAVLTAILIHGLVDTPYFKNDLSVIFWILIALIIIQIKQIAPENK